MHREFFGVIRTRGHRGGWGVGCVKLRLKILAWCHVVFGGIGLSIVALLLFAYALRPDPEYQDEMVAIGSVLGLLGFAYCLPSLIGGIGLLRGRPLARIIIWCESAALALLVPVGTVLCAISLWVLLSTWDPEEIGDLGSIERFVQRSLRTIMLMLVALFILGAILLTGYLFRDVIDPPGRQQLTPMPEMPKFDPPPEFKMPDLKEYEIPRAPGQ